LPAAQTVIKKLLLLLLCLVAVVLAGICIKEYAWLIFPFQSTGKAVTVDLQRGHFTVYEFPARDSPPRALILFGSGDGGWTAWEESVAHALQAQGYTVVGIDSANYARTDYDLATLQADFNTIARRELAAYQPSPPPLILAGWSMGAGQAIAVAGGPNPPPRLVGLALISPLSRGRYGLRLLDRLNALPTGPGTFAVEDFISNLDSLRIAQWHAANDTIDSRAWLSDLKAVHHEYDFPNAGHEYGGPSPDFLHQLTDSVSWILKPSASP